MASTSWWSTDRPIQRVPGTTAAAGYPGITPRTLYRLIDQGQVPACALGRVYRVRSSDLDAYLESVRVKPGTLGHLLGAT